ncbi:hypothetical protein [Aquihabitans sp. McL0605]|uniref:hypothetical protein n=1 Tax=Aquihabitans sp. McL0605 TaxID=3415671 RepID=UPI003CEA25E8
MPGEPTSLGDRPRVLAYSDCEHCRPGLVSQPANTVSSLAYVAAGAELLRHHHPDRAYAWSLIGVGMGSVAYHGPGGAAGKWAHDATLLAMFGLMALSDITIAEGRPMSPAAIAGVTAAAAAGAHPRTTDVAQGVAGALALAATARRFTHSTAHRDLVVSLPLWVVGLTLQVLGRTGQPLCRPESPFQAHAAWHVLSAAALWTRRRF